MRNSRQELQKRCFRTNFSTLIRTARLPCTSSPCPPKRKKTKQNKQTNKKPRLIPRKEINSRKYFGRELLVYIESHFPVTIEGVENSCNSLYAQGKEFQLIYSESLVFVPWIWRDVMGYCMFQTSEIKRAETVAGTLFRGLHDPV